MTEILVTCEHGGNRVPAPYAALFRGAGPVLRSHRGFDPGALRCARGLAARLDAPLLSVVVTRLLVDANRSPENPAVFSPFTRGLTPEEREPLLASHHAPHWLRVEETLRRGIERSGRVLHLAIHSFTPRLRRRVRMLDVGILYDPARPGERRFASDWKASLASVAPELRVRRNAPYRGYDDGLTRAMRLRFGPSEYLGIEVELNQARVALPRPAADRMTETLLRGLSGIPGLLSRSGFGFGEDAETIASSRAVAWLARPGS